MKFNFTIAKPDTEPRFVVSQRLCSFINTLIQRHIFDKTPVLSEYEARIVAVHVTTRDGQERVEASPAPEVVETTKHTYYNYEVYLPQQTVYEDDQYPQEQFVLGAITGTRLALAEYHVQESVFEDLLEIALREVQAGNYGLTGQERRLANQVNYMEAIRINEYRNSTRKGGRRR